METVFVSVAGLPKGRVAAAEAAIRSALVTWGADELSIIAHRLHDGEWLLTVFDGVNMVTLKDGLRERVLLALSELS